MRTVTLLTSVLGLTACSTLPDNAVMLAEIWEQRDQRRGDDTNHLERLLSHPDIEVQRQAAFALGDIGAKNAPAALSRKLHYPGNHPSVTAACLFAWGRCATTSEPDMLREWLTSDDATLRRAATACITDRDLPLLRLVAQMVADADPAVRGSAALACLRMVGDPGRSRKPEHKTPQAKATRAHLCATLRPALAKEQDTIAHWHLTYVLATCRLEDNREALTAVATGAAARRYSRIFAARGLRLLTSNPHTRDAFVKLLSDEDPSLVYEVVRGLGNVPGTATARHPNQGVGLALLKLIDHKSTAVRDAVVDALGFYPELQPELGHLLRRSGRDGRLPASWLSSWMRLHGDKGIPEVDLALDHTDWRRRAAAATALRLATPNLALSRLQRCITDKQVKVRIAALQATQELRSTSDVMPLLQLAAKDQDMAVREFFAGACEKLGNPSAIPLLLRAYGTSPGDSFAEARKLILQAAAKLANRTRQEEPIRTTEELLRSAVRDPNGVVRRAAVTELNRRRLRVPQHDDLDLLEQQRRSTPMPGQEIPWSFLQARPLLTVTTNRGTFELELRPDHAPIHCFNLTKLALSRAYNNRIFHRIVPNFVAQGGDARGDGSGATSIWGGSIRDEINPLLFAAGALGMPKTADNDTGGDQIFITTVPTPHLDRRYTVFGQVVSGLTVVERLEVGDKILNVAVRSAGL